MKKRISILLILTMIMSTVITMPLCSFAAAGNSDDPDNTWTLYNGSCGVIELNVYNDDVFTKDGAKYDPQLAVMTIALSSASCNSTRYNDDSEKYDVIARNAHDYLEDNGFSDVCANEDYSVKPDGTKAPAIFAHKKITDSGKDYTLLAIVPKSGALEAEFFPMATASSKYGDRDDYAYFVLLRDKTLKSAREYINNYGIKGDIKVWVPGYSRGGGVANLLVASLVDDPAAALGGNVRLANSDIYCYTLSSYRSAVNTRDLKAKKYDVIHHIISKHDMLLKLPWENMGFGWYGQVREMTDGVDREEALRLTKISSESLYESLINGQDPELFTPMKLDMEALLNGTVSMIPDEDSYLPYNQGEFIDAIMDPIDEIFNEDGGDVRDGYYENYQTPLTNLLKYYKTYNLPGATELMGSKTAVPYILSTYISFIAYRTTKNNNVKASELNNAVESTFNSLAYNIEDEDGNVRRDMVKLKGTEAAYKLLKKLYFTENEEIVTDENGIPAKYKLRKGVKIDGNFSRAIRKLTAKLYSMTMNDILTAQGVESELVSAMTSEEDSAAISYFLTHFLFDNSLQSSRIKPLNPDNEQFKQLATIIGCFKSCDATHYVEVDYAWLQAASGLYSDYEGPTDSNLAGYRRLSISKPESVDINGTVRDENGKAVAVFRNGKLVSRTDKWIGYTGSDEGGWFRLPFDHSYTVEMKVSKDSKINVSVGEYSFKEGSVLRNVDTDSQYDWTKLDAYKSGAVVLSLPKVSEDYNLPSKAEYSISVSGNSQSDSKDITDNTDTPDVTVVKTKYSSSVPKAMNVKAKAGTKSVTVSWKKLSSKKLKKFSKVEVQYSTSKNFKNYKSIDVSKSKTSLKIKGLKKNKTYYVRVRNVKKSTGVRYVSKWSAVCKAKAK